MVNDWTELGRVFAETAYSQSPTTGRTYLTGVVYAYALERTGHPEHADTVRARMEHYVGEQIEAGGTGAQFHHAMAVIHTLRGEQDEAFDWLDEAIRLGWNHTALLPDGDPLLGGLYEDPRFRFALDRMEVQIDSMRAAWIENGSE